MKTPVKWEPVKSIFRTSDLGQFKKQIGNRDVTESNVNNIMKRIQEHGFIEDYHIIVNENMQVVDGQNRLEAARRLGSPVCFSIASREIPPDLNRKLNSTARRWQNADYLKSFVDEGYEEYVKLKELVDSSLPGQKHLSLHSILVLSGFTGGRDAVTKGQAGFRSGHFKMPEPSSDFWAALDIVSVMASSGVHFFSRTKTLQAALRLVRIKGFDPERMKERLNNFAHELRQSTTNDGQLQELVDFYNYRLHGPNRIEVPR